MPTGAGDVWRVTAKMSYEGNDVQNVYHIKWSGTGFAGESTLLGDVSDVLDDVYDLLDAYFRTTLYFDSIEAYNLTDDQYVGEQAWPTLVTGGDGAASMPPQVAPLLLLGTDTLRSQGRKFFPWPTYSAIDTDGTPTNALLASLLSAGAQLIAAHTIGTYEFAFGNWRAGANIFIYYTDASAPNYFATQRRRYRGSGS